MQNDANSKENYEMEMNERSRRIFLNAILEPLKQRSIPGLPPELLTIQKNKGIELGTAAQVNNTEQEQTIRVLERGLRKNQETIGNFCATIQEKEARERELSNKIDGTLKICDICPQHYNRLCDNYKGVENVRDNLSGMLNKVLRVQEKEIQELKETVKKQVNASAEQKRLLAEAESRFANQEQRVCELLERINELESSLSLKENSLNTFAAKHDCENLRAEKEHLYSRLKQVEAEKENASKFLAEKNELEGELRASSLRVEELSRYTAEYSARNELLAREKENLEKQMENFVAMKEENEKLAREVTDWKERSKEADRDCLKLEQSLREVERRYGELEKSAWEKGLQDADIVKELCKKLESMEEKQKQRDINMELEIKGLQKSCEEKHKQEVMSLMASKKKIEMKLLDTEKMLSQKKCNLKNINVKLAETIKQKTSLQNEIRKIKAINNKLEKELKGKVTTNKTKDLSTESIENDKDLTEKPVTDDTQYSSTSTERKNLVTFSYKSINERFSKSSSSLKLAEASKRDPYDFAKTLLEQDLHESSSLHKNLRDKSFAKLNERHTLSQPAMESPFKIPDPPKSPSLTDTNTPPQKKKRFFVSDRSVRNEVSKPRKHNRLKEDAQYEYILYIITHL